MASLTAELGRHLRAAPGAVVEEREISAVHISELADPTVYLNGGELLLTTGLGLVDGPACEEYVARLVDAGVAGLGFGLGPVHDAVPPSLAAACGSRGLALFVVPEATPFITISRAYWTGVARSGEQRLVDQLGAQRALADAAVAPDPARAVVRTLSKWLPGWAAVLSQEGEVLQVAPSSSGAAAGAVGHNAQLMGRHRTRSPWAASEGGRQVLVYPLGSPRSPRGFLAVGTARRVDPALRRTVMSGAALLGLVTSQSALDRATADARAESVAALLDLGMPEPARRLAAEFGLPPVPDRVRVAALRSELDSAAVAALARHYPSYGHRRVAVGTWWFALPVEPPRSAMWVSDLAGLDPDLTLKVSAPVGATQIGTERLRGLAALASLPDGTIDLGPEEFPGAVALLDRLLAEGSPVLVDALAGYLRHRGQWEAAARDLASHRNTLRYRIDRVRALLDCDLDDPDVGSALWIELRHRGLA